jgi:hypothetical protein
MASISLNMELKFVKSKLCTIDKRYMAVIMRSSAWQEVIRKLFRLKTLRYEFKLSGSAFNDLDAIPPFETCWSSLRMTNSSCNLKA